MRSPSIRLEIPRVIGSSYLKHGALFFQLVMRFMTLSPQKYHSQTLSISEDDFQLLFFYQAKTAFESIEANIFIKAAAMFFLFFMGLVFQFFFVGFALRNKGLISGQKLRETNGFHKLLLWCSNFLLGFPLKNRGCRFVPYTSSETSRHRWYLRILRGGFP